MLNKNSSSPTLTAVMSVKLLLSNQSELCVYLTYRQAYTENLAKLDETESIRGITSGMGNPEKADVCREQIQTFLLPLFLKTGGKLVVLTYSDPQLDIVTLRRPLKYAVSYICAARNLNRKFM
jgi:hypothetical protein